MSKPCVGKSESTADMFVPLSPVPLLHSVVSDNKVAATLKLMTRPPDTKLTPDVARELSFDAGGWVRDHGMREVLQLIDLQIETLKQESSLDSPQLQDYQARSERIRQLYGELDRIRGARIEFKFARAS
ncbi:MAG TPA: hypothetical protein VIH75_06340 [Candidatus Sulfotelmatobacter sp.]